MTATFAAYVTDRISALAPIHGVSIGRRDDIGTWRIDFSSDATDAQRTAAKNALLSIDARDFECRVYIVQERTRRLALGFDYDFGGARGVHRIGTTADDMTGWREVTDYANALIDLGDVTTEIAIVTDTGPVSVTAPEWQAVMLTAARTRQVIWEKSFALQAMQPIPADYADDRHWS